MGVFEDGDFAEQDRSNHVARGGVAHSERCEVIDRIDEAQCGPVDGNMNIDFADHTLGVIFAVLDAIVHEIDEGRQLVFFDGQTASHRVSTTFDKQAGLARGDESCAQIKAWHRPS